MADVEAVAILRHPHTLYNHSNLRMYAYAYAHALICINTLQKSWEMPPNI